MTITEDDEVSDTEGFFKRLVLQRYSTSAALSAGRFNDVWVGDVDEDDTVRDDIAAGLGDEGNEPSLPLPQLLRARLKLVPTRSTSSDPTKRRLMPPSPSTQS